MSAADSCRADRHRSILFAMPHLTFGGAERLSSNILGHLVQGGCGVTVAVMSAKKGLAEASEWFSAAASIERLDEAGLALGERLAALLEARQATALALIGLSPVFHVLPGLRRALPDLRVVSFQFNEQELTAEHRLYWHLLDLIVAEGEIVARTLAGAGVDPDRIAVIPSGPNLDALARRSGPPLPAVAGLARPVVAYVGRMDPIKGPLVFVEICAWLRERGCSLLMAGDGPIARDVERAITAAGLATRVIRLGQISHDDVPRLFAGIDVLVVPSLIDGRPLVVQEAQACGVAVVASRVGSIPDLIEDGVTGRLCPPGDVEAFASAVGALIADPAARTALAHRARERVMRAGGLGASLAAYAAAITGRNG